MAFLSRLALLLIYVSIISASLLDCPADWITDEYGQNCYKFVSYPKLTYESAAAYCVSTGAYLLSVNGAQEHAFINEWLQGNDKIQRNRWYTSGSFRSSATATWEGDNTDYGLTFNGASHWTLTGRNKPGDRIIYEFDGVTYGWGRSYGNDSIGFICEINQNDADRIISERRDYTYGSTEYNARDLEYGPVFTVSPEDIVMIPSATLVRLDCSAAGNPPPTYRWFRVDGITEREIKPAQEEDLSSRYTMTSGKLSIQNPVDSDLGQYRCEAVNKFGVIRSRKIQVSFGSLGEFSNVQDAPVNLFEHDGAAVECSRIGYKPAVVYTWKRKLSDDKITTVYTEVMPHIFISNNGKLYFTEIQSDDAGDYYCQVDLFGLSRNAVGAAQPPSRTSYPIEVIVNNQADKPDWGPSIQNDFLAVFPKPPMRGRDIMIECFAYGSAKNYQSAWLYKWARQGAAMPAKARMEDFNRVLIIPNAEKDDEGTYTCTVSRNNVQSDSKSVSLVLSATPYFIIPLKNQHLDKGSSITWRCQASGTPAPQYTWYKNGVMLQSQPDILVNRNLLVITNADAKRHSGMYQCRASNDLGESYSSAEVRVLSFAPTFRKNPLPKEMIAALRGNVTIECEPEAAPSPEITWSKNNAGLNLQTGTMTSGGRLRKLPSGNIYITDIQQGDAGVYTCTAANDNGKATSFTRLSVKASAVITVRPKQLQTIIVNDTAYLGCEASYNPSLDLIYIWRFNGRMLDIENDPHYAKSTHAPGLMVRMAQIWHAGIYECVARTTLSEASAAGQLKVEGPPGEPLGVYGDTASITSTSLHLFWFPGADHGKPITHFRIQAESDFEHGVWNDVANNIPESQTKFSGNTRDLRHFIVVGLDPGNGYRFRVQAINQLGFGKYSDPSKYYQTLAAPPSKAPDNLGGGGGSVGDLVITWTKLHRRYHGSTGLTYTLYWRRHNVQSAGKWELTAGLTSDIDRYVTSVGEDNFYTEYEVKIQAKNNLGPGPNSSSVLVYSAEGMPIAAPLNVYAEGYNSTALEVSWTPVANTRDIMKGVIGGYQINYWLRYEKEPVYKRFIRYKGQRSSGLIIGLAVDTYYLAEVQVFNTAGFGPLGEKYPGETMSMAPILYPTEVYVLSDGAESVRVTWRGISTQTAEDTLKGYKIFLWKANENSRQAEEFITEKFPTEQVLTGLEKDYVYAVRVSGHSNGGDGAKSPTVYFALGKSQIILDQTVTEITAGAPRNVQSIICLLITSLLMLFL